MVKFTKTGAVYRPGNGNVIHYQYVNGIYYHVETLDAVVQALERARATHQRIRVYYGDANTGRDWLEEHDVEGDVAISTGPLQVPLPICDSRSHGGGAMLDHCVVKVKWAAGGVLYQHPTYHTGTFAILETEPNNPVRKEGYPHAVDIKERA